MAVQYAQTAEFERYEDGEDYFGIIYDPKVNNWDGEGIYYKTPPCATKSEVRRYVAKWYETNRFYWSEPRQNMARISGAFIPFT